MSFNFSWPTFSRQFHTDAARMLDAALNRGPKPKVIADDIKVEDIYMGTIPPELEILEIGELSSERLRGIFRLTYTGDAHLILSTKVQANPLTRPDSGNSSTSFEDVSSAFPSSSTSRGILFAARPLVVPMQLRLSSMRLKAIIVLVVSKQKGITLVFKNDPLESVDVSSTFDSVAVIQKYLQQEIEGQLREMFREDLPGIIHRLSQNWLSSRSRKQTSAQATMTSKPSSVSAPQRSPELQQSAEIAGDTSMAPSSRKARSNASVPASHHNNIKGKSPARRRKSDRAATTIASPSSSPPQRSSAVNTPKASRMKGRTSSNKMITPMSSPSKVRVASTSKNAVGDSTFASSSGSPGGVAQDLESYDPTYGLRPNEVRMTGNAETFKSFAVLSGRTTRGFGDFATLASTPEKDKEQRQLPVSSSVPSMLDLTRDAAGHEEDMVEEDIEEVGQLEDIEDGDIFRDDADVDDVDDVDDLSSDEDQSDSFAQEQNSDSDEDSETESEEEEDLTIDESMPQIQTSLDFSSGLSHRRKSDTNRAVSAQRMRTASSTSKKPGPAAADVEYETIPAVGGGMATRPRVYHIASRVQAPDVEEEDDLASAVHAMSSVAASSTAKGPASSRAQTVRARRSYDNFAERGEGQHGYDDEGRDYSTDESPSAAGHESLATLEPVEMDPASIAYRTQLYRQQYGGLYRPGYGRNSSISSAEVSSGASSSRHPSYSPDEDYTVRRRGMTPGSGTSTAPTSAHVSTTYETRQPWSSSSSRGITPDRGGELFHHNQAPPVQKHATLSPSTSLSNAMTVNASNHFMDLVNSNHTLSPFTRTLDTKGFAVRSHPVTPSASSVASGNTGSVTSGRSNQENHSTHRVKVKGEDNKSSGALPSFTSRPSMSGRRRTFKLGGASSKSVGNTPSTVPTTPVSETGAMANGVNDYRSWRPSSAYTPSVTQDRSDFGGFEDAGEHGAVYKGQLRPKLSSSQTHNGYGSAAPTRRSSYDRRLYDNVGGGGRGGSASASLIGGESEYSGSGVRMMNPIRE